MEEGQEDEGGDGERDETRVARKRGGGGRKEKKWQETRESREIKIDK